MRSLSNRRCHQDGRGPFRDSGCHESASSIQRVSRRNSSSSIPHCQHSGQPLLHGLRSGLWHFRQTAVRGSQRGQNADGSGHVFDIYVSSCICVPSSHCPLSSTQSCLRQYRPTLKRDAASRTSAENPVERARGRAHLALVRWQGCALCHAAEGALLSGERDHRETRRDKERCAGGRRTQVRVWARLLAPQPWALPPRASRAGDPHRSHSPVAFRL